jgi:hypothetical protein
VTWIAEEAIVFLYPDGRRVDGRIAIGLPTMVDDHEARCELALEPLDPRIRGYSGEGKLQALVSALRIAGTLIDAFLKEGGRLLCPGDDPEDPEGDVDFAIEAVLGPLLAPPAGRRDAGSPDRG